MSHEAIFDGSLYVRHDLAGWSARNRAFWLDNRVRAHFASQLLLYDRIVIPTKDFGILAAIASWTDARVLQEILESGAVSLLRPRSLICYAGGGAGLNIGAIEWDNDKPVAWDVEAVLGSLEKSCEAQVQNGCAAPDHRTVTQIVDAALRNTVELRFDERLSREVSTNVYLDVQKSDALKASIFALERPSSTRIPLQGLPGVAPNQLRVYSDRPARDGIDVLLSLAECNLELEAATICGDVDMVASPLARHVLEAKLAQRGVGPAFVEQAFRLFDLAKVPDIRVPLEAGTISVHDIWKVRQTADAVRFRAWLRAWTGTDPRDLEKAYVESIGRIPSCQSWPIRLLRFVGVTLLGLPNPIVGAAAGAADSFFVDKLAAGYSPRLFLDRLTRLQGP